MKKLTTLLLIIFQTTLLMGMDDARLENPAEYDFDTMFAAKKEELKKEVQKLFKTYEQLLVADKPENMLQEAFDNDIRLARLILAQKDSIIDNTNAPNLLRPVFNDPDHLKAFQKARVAIVDIAKITAETPLHNSLVLDDIISKWGKALKLLHISFHESTPNDKDLACAGTVLTAIYTLHTQPLIVFVPEGEDGLYDRIFAHIN